MRFNINMVRKGSKTENLVYLGLWVAAFVAPLLNAYFGSFTEVDRSFDWQELSRSWRQVGLFFLLFVLHNYLLAPLLVYRQRKGAYFGLVTAIVISFLVMECTFRPEPPGGERSELDPPKEQVDRIPVPPGSDRKMVRKTPPMGPKMRNAGKKHEGRPPMIIGGREVTEAILLILMAGMNIGVKLYFKSLRDRNQLELLKRESLEHQLEYLKYQINPHFFMNTLNNIHALVDINPEKAKQSVVELSRMMRYVLYEGNQQMVPIQKELDFIRHYVALMQLRYTDEVAISLSLPDPAPEGNMPPLVLVTFIENAFKHGVSYSHASHVAVKASVADGQLLFECRNSKSAKPNTEHKQGGVGLENVRRRLALIYGERHQLTIDDGEAEYVVRLSLTV